MIKRLSTLRVALGLTGIISGCARAPEPHSPVDIPYPPAQTSAQVVSQVSQTHLAIDANCGGLLNTCLLPERVTDRIPTVNEHTIIYKKDYDTGAIFVVGCDQTEQCAQYAEIVHRALNSVEKSLQHLLIAALQTKQPSVNLEDIEEIADEIITGFSNSGDITVSIWQEVLNTNQTFFIPQSPKNTPAIVQHAILTGQPTALDTPLLTQPELITSQPASSISYGRGAPWEDPGHHMIVVNIPRMNALLNRCPTNGEHKFSNEEIIALAIIKERSAQFALYLENQFPSVHETLMEQWLYEQPDGYTHEFFSAVMLINAAEGLYTK